jgi:hypothetical protein
MFFIERRMMMKKLLILTLVLGMVSMAVATPTITVSNSTPVNGEVIQVYITGTAADANPDGSTATGGWSGFVAIDYATLGPTGGTMYLSLSPNPAVTPAAGGYAQYSTSSALEYFAAMPLLPWAEETDVDAGLWFTYDVTVNGVDGDSELIDLLDNALGIVTSVQINIIPEPITMALLGLGGLFLRRRK